MGLEWGYGGGNGNKLASEVRQIGHLSQFSPMDELSLDVSWLESRADDEHSPVEGWSGLVEGLEWDKVGLEWVRLGLLEELG